MYTREKILDYIEIPLVIDTLEKSVVFREISIVVIQLLLYALSDSKRELYNRNCEQPPLVARKNRLF